jgi:hypothetical protein
MTAHRRAKAVAALDEIPVATLVHLILVVAFAVSFVLNGGHLTDDALKFFAVGEAGNGLLGVGRGLSKRR